MMKLYFIIYDMKTEQLSDSEQKESGREEEEGIRRACLMFARTTKHECEKKAAEEKGY